ncbi:MAG: hypothetical protein KatS3mg085_843 [Candidatus Dojkabacteria bacterium]|nr:MAG: hypothetical protein KatS3mg085_843 [Candidatus Dojkabacteria bacterium]
MDTDPAKRQYYIFSLVVAIILSFIINFVVIETLKGSLFYGFPLSLNGVTGFVAFIYKLINTIIYSLLLSVAVYYGIMWLINRGSSY